MVQKEAERTQAIALRRQGLSYREILKQIPVAKSSLSLWLQSVGLSKKQKQRLTEKKWNSLQKGLATIKATRILRRSEIEQKAKGEFRRLMEDPLWVLGLALYWAEGTKFKPWNSSPRVAFSNMDPSTHLVILQWLEKYARVSRQDIAYELFVHQNSKNRTSFIKRYWTELLKIHASQIKVYYKKSQIKTRRRNVEQAYYGVLQIRVRKSAALGYRIKTWIAELCKYYCGVV